MKHLRLFEELKTTEPKYKVGDYIHVNMEPNRDYDDCLARITKIDKNGFLISPEDEDSPDYYKFINSYNPFPYSVDFYNNGWNIKENLIDRLLSDDEIIYFEYLKEHGTEIKKFNL